MKLRDVPCKCGWKFLTFHICLDLTEAELKKIQNGKKKERKEAKESRISERNYQIVRYYVDDEMTILNIAKQMGINHQTVGRVLHKAQDNGDLVMRTRTRSKQVANARS